jgi:hypothetical protein
LRQGSTNAIEKCRRGEQILRHPLNGVSILENKESHQ